MYGNWAQIDKKNVDSKNQDESGYLPSPSLDLLRSSLYPEKTRQWCSDVWAALPILNLALFCKLHTTSYLIFRLKNVYIGIYYNDIHDHVL